MARKLWIHVTDSFTITERINNPTFFATACLGFGHVMPIDDFPIPRMTGIMLESFKLHDPKMNVTQLALPSMDTFSSKTTPNGLVVEKGDMAAHKVVFGPEAAKGTYQFTAETPEYFITQYNKDGKTVWDPSPMSAFGADAQIDASIRVKINAKATATYGHWTEPEPMGWELEILPKTPLDHVMPNQPVEFEVRYMGEPLGCTPNEMEFLLAASNTYGGEGAGDTDGFFLAAYLMGGKARMSFPTAGEWVVTVFTNKPVLPGGKFDAYKNECKQVFHSAGLSLNVRTI